MTHRGSSRGLSDSSAETWPPAASTAARSGAGAFDRVSSRAKNATVIASGSMPCMAVATTSTSASFQRSTPSAITKRRPSAKVIADSARATASGVDASPSSTSTPAAPLSSSAIRRRRVRRSAMRPWSSPVTR